MEMKCKKCGCNHIHSQGLCKTCYNKYYYSNRHHGTSLQDFIQKDRKTYYHTGLKNYKDFVEIYTNGQKIKKQDMAKKLNISRETLYKYIHLYKDSIRG